MQQDKFWLLDPAVLYRNDKYLDFIPRTDMSKIEQVNALFRLLIYGIILVTLFSIQHVGTIALALGLILLIVYAYAHSPIINKYEKQPDITIESGFYDSNDNMMTGYTNPIENNKYTRQQLDEYDRLTCRKPTADNPFMNPTASDFMNYDSEIPKPCNVDDTVQGVKMSEDVDNKFYEGLFLDKSDLFERFNTERLFFTIPQSYPTDQTDFANWLYNTEGICKTNPLKCLA